MFTQHVVFATPPFALINAIFLNRTLHVRLACFGSRLVSYLHEGTFCGFSTTHHRERPSLSGCPRPVIGLDDGFYLDRVSAGGKTPGGTRQAAARLPIVEPHWLPVEVHVYVVPGQEYTVPVLYDGPDGGVRVIDDSGGCNRGYEDRAPRTTAAPWPSAAGSPPSSHALSTPPQRCQCSSRSWSLVSSTAPPQERSSNRKRKGEAGVAWFLAGEENPGMRTGYPARRSRPNRPNLTPLISLS